MNALSIQSSGTLVSITWVDPSDNGGLSVTSYQLQFKKNDGNYATISTCSLINSPTKSCSIPMTSFTNSPFSLSVGALIIGQIKSSNSFGQSTEWSDPNTTGATAKKAPGSPTSLSKLSDTN